METAAFNLPNNTKETVPCCSFLLKFCGVCPIHLQSSARRIFILSHNSLIISDVVIFHLHQHSTIINSLVDKHKRCPHKKAPCSHFKTTRHFMYPVFYPFLSPVPDDTNLESCYKVH